MPQQEREKQLVGTLALPRIDAKYRRAKGIRQNKETNLFFDAHSVLT